MNFISFHFISRFVFLLLTKRTLSAGLVRYPSVCPMGDENRKKDRKLWWELRNHKCDKLRRHWLAWPIFFTFILLTIFFFIWSWFLAFSMLIMWRIDVCNVALCWLRCMLGGIMGFNVNGDNDKMYFCAKQWKKALCFVDLIWANVRNWMKIVLQNELGENKLGHRKGL